MLVYVSKKINLSFASKLTINPRNTMPDRSRNLQKRQNETLVNVSLKKRIKKNSKFRFKTYYQSKYPKPNPTKKDKRNVNVSLKKNKKIRNFASKLTHPTNPLNGSREKT